MNQLLLKIQCPDQPGVVAKVSTKLFSLNANIIQNSEFRDETSQQFLMRCVFTTSLSQAEVQSCLKPVLDELKAEYKLRQTQKPTKTIILVSKQDHCLLDIFYKVKNQELNLEIAAVISNHETHEEVTKYYGHNFIYNPVGENKYESEVIIKKIAEKEQIDLIVLARYMQILTPEICEQYSGKIINIHHSFLPSFKGADPYKQAYERGVKLIGATAHYVTSKLDEGPIICQDVTAISHADDTQTMRTLGKDIERKVLTQAIKAETEERIFLLGHKTVVI